MYRLRAVITESFDDIVFGHESAHVIIGKLREVEK